MKRRSFLLALLAVPFAANAPLVCRDAQVGISIRFIRHYDPTHIGLLLHPDAFAIVMKPLERALN